MGAVAGRIVGQSIPRTENARLLTGRGRFVADVELPRMLHAAFVRSYLPHAVIDQVQLDEAIALRGVANVLVAADLPDVHMSSSRHSKLAITPQPPLAHDKVRFVGEAVAIALADNRYLAEDAADLVQVYYTPVNSGAPLYDHIPDNLVFHDAEVIGPVDRAFDEAHHVTRQELDMARQNASPMEARGCVADFDPVARRLTVYSCTQGPHRLRRDLAGVTGLNEHQIRVVILDIGVGSARRSPPRLRMSPSYSRP